MKFLASLAVAALLLFAGIAFSAPTHAADITQTYDFCADFQPVSKADWRQYNANCSPRRVAKYVCPEVKPSKTRDPQAYIAWLEHKCKESPPVTPPSEHNDYTPPPEDEEEPCPDPEDEYSDEDDKPDWGDDDSDNEGHDDDGDKPDWGDDSDDGDDSGDEGGDEGGDSGDEGGDE